MCVRYIDMRSILSKAPERTMTTASISIEELRELRTTAHRLNSTVVEHLRPFQQLNGSFKTLPDSTIKKHAENHPKIPDISVASTATVFMAAIGTGTLKEFFGGERRSVRQVFADALRSKWGSSGLEDGNAFTTALIVRAAGMLLEGKHIKPSDLTDVKHPEYPG